MKIAVNTRLLLKGKLDGIGWFALETLRRITAAHPEHQFYFIFDRKYDKDFIFSKNVTPIVAYPQARHPFLYYIWFEFSVKRVLKAIGADVFVSPDGYLSLSSAIPSVAVIHDLNFEYYPKDLPLLDRAYYRYFFPKFAAHAQRIATVSEFSKSNLVDLYNVPADKVDVIYNGANTRYVPVSVQEQELTRAKYTDGNSYFLFIGSLHPRKNLVNLFQAFDLFKSTTDNSYKLLIVGRKMWWTGSIREAFENMIHREDVIFADYLPSEDLSKVIGSALALTYVSYFEGFGIPIIEGMYCDVPVITANVTAMPEIGGDAVLQVDPFSIESIAEGMRKIAQDPVFSKALVEKGRERRTLFTWDKTAARFWDSIEKVLNEGRGR
ncbi:glycosyltransferase family 1 protein [Cytophagaceae bacterium ABcell3]|nr:glycosyltransferase family 1 protein [Cytophagaceae bacterium ABcell3]